MLKEFDKELLVLIDGKEKKITIKNIAILFLILGLSCCILSSLAGIFLKGSLNIIAIAFGPIGVYYLLTEFEEKALQLLNDRFVN